LIKIISVSLAIIIIPLEIFVQHVLQQKEGELILIIQRSFGQNQAVISTMLVPLVLVRPYVTLLFMQFLYLTTDSLIAFKVREILY
jgi:hypothetical protein